MLNITTYLQVLNPINSNDETVNIEVNLDFPNGVQGNFVGFYKMNDVDITRTLSYPQTLAVHVNEGTNITFTVINGTKIYTCIIGAFNLIDDISAEDRLYLEICELDGVDGGGCTNETALNYDPNAIYDNGSCVFSQRINGCTDPLAVNYNPSANFDDGSCIYSPQSSGVTIIRGCTNELASNYNPNANLNDGSCIFQSGCTISISSNYNPLAVIDDGSCVCSEYELFFESGDTLLNVGNYLQSSGTCMAYVKFDMLLEINCDSILNNVATNEVRLTDKLNDISIGFRANSENNIFYQESIYLGQEDTYFIDGELCDLFNELYNFENNVPCDIVNNEKINKTFKTVEVIFPITSGVTSLSLFIENVDFDHSIVLDNVQILLYCEEDIIECKLMPKKYGFNLHKVLVENKVNLIQENYINNSEVTIRVNPIEHINNDVIDYFNNYGYYGRRDRLFSLSQEELVYDMINIKRHKIDSEYHHLKNIYDLYLENQDSCSLPNKRLDTDYVFYIYDKINPKWRETLKNFVDPTLDTLHSDYYFNNNLFTTSKHKYKKYTLDRGCDADADLDFEIITDNVCIDNNFKSRFEIFNADNCIPCNNSGVTYSYFDDGISESGRLIQYTGETFTNSGITEVINYDTYVFSDCYEDEECPAVNVEITGYSFIGKNVLQVDFITTGVNDPSEIDIYVNNVLNFNSNQFDPETQIGIFLYITTTIDPIDILIAVSNDCGSDVDSINNILPL